MGVLFVQTLLYILPMDRIYDWKMTEVVGGIAQANTISKTRTFREESVVSLLFLRLRGGQLFLL